MVKKSLACFFIYVGASLLVGCGSLQEKQSSVLTGKSTVNLAKSASSTSIKKKLFTQYYQWRGVRYKLGGLTRRGIDCSGFVMVTFKSQFNIDLPRTTRYQANLGQFVSKSELKVGDLVFFKTGLTTRHVGIYLEHGKFLHASSSKGVTISRLNNMYWRSNYWKSVRI